MSRVFVTGANGFIGSHLVGALLERGDEVIALVRPTSDLRSLQPFFETYGPRLKIVVGDVRRPDTFAAYLADVEYVYHLAAVLMGTSEQEFMESNTEGTRNVFEAVMGGRGPQFKRVLFTSSQAAAGPSPSAQPIDETHPASPISWYGESKKRAEEIAREYRDKGLPVTVARPVAVYGARERDLSGGTFPIVNLGLKPMIGVRRKVVSFVHVEDLVRGLIDAASDAATEGRTYFLGDPSTYRDTEITDAVADALGTRVRIPVVTPQFLLRLAGIAGEWVHHFTRARAALTRDKAREVSQRFWAASAAAAKNDFGWEARVGLADGMRRAVADWKERQRLAHPANERLRDRAIKTFTIALVFGIAIESTSFFAGWYRFDPWWLIFLVIVGFFGGVMGAVSLWSVRHAIPLQFLWGFIIGSGVELANHFWLHIWIFDPDTFGRLPAPWIRALVLGVPVGLIPVIVNQIIAGLYRLRRRVG